MFVEVLTSGVAGSVEVPDIIDVIGYIADQVALHNLHVVDVVEEFDSRRAYRSAHGYAPGGSVALVVGVVNARVEQFHAKGDAFFLGRRGDPEQPLDAIGQAFFV